MNANATPAELLITAATAGREDALAAWSAYQMRRGTTSIVGEELRLLPLVYRNLADCGVRDGEIPGLCREMYRATWVRSRMQLRELETLLDAMAAERIDAMLLKGAALTAAYYAHAAARPMSDIDVLVSPADAPAVASLLETSGWRARLPFDRKSMHVRHGCEFRKGEVKIDLHWSVFWESLDAHAGERFWDHAEEVAVGSRRARVLRAEHQLLHVIVHGTRRGEGARLRWIADAITILRTRGGRFDWVFFEAEVRTTGFAFPVGEALRHLSQRYAVPIPDDLVSRLTGVRPTRMQRSVYGVVPDDDGHPLTFVAPLVYKFLRQSRGRGLAAHVTWFPRNLQQAWGVSSMRRLPLEIVRRSAAKLRQLTQPSRR